MVFRPSRGYNWLILYRMVTMSLRSSQRNDPVLGGLNWFRLSRSYLRLQLNRDLRRYDSVVQGLVLDVGGEPDSQVAYRWTGSTVRRWVALNINSRSGVALVGDGHHLPLLSASADSVVCSEVLEHVRDPRRVVSELARVLKPGGVMLLAVPFLYGLHSVPYDYWRFTRFGLEELVRSAGLEVVETRGQGGWFTLAGDVLKRGLSHLRPAPLRWLLWLPLMPLATLLASLERGGGDYDAGVLLLARKKAH